MSSIETFLSKDTVKQENFTRKRFHCRSFVAKLANFPNKFYYRARHGESSEFSFLCVTVAIL